MLLFGTCFGSTCYFKLSVFVSLFVVTVAKDNDKQEFVDVIRQAPFSLVSSFICFLSIWSVIGLAGFHTYLTTSDQTTNEDVC